MISNQRKIDKSKQEQLNRVISSLDRVKPDVKQMIYDMSNSMSEVDIIQLFNQESLDMFALCIYISQKMGKENEIKIGGYKNLFDHAVSFNKKLPLDQFTLSILEFAADIYDENEKAFLGKEYKDVELKVGNEYSFIRSDVFKKLWMILSEKDKSDIKEKLISVTTYAHAYLYKVLLQKKN